MTYGAELKLRMAPLCLLSNANLKRPRTSVCSVISKLTILVLFYLVIRLLLLLLPLPLPLLLPLLVLLILLPNLVVHIVLPNPWTRLYLKSLRSPAVADVLATRRSLLSPIKQPPHLLRARLVGSQHQAPCSAMRMPLKLLPRKSKTIVTYFPLKILLLDLLMNLPFIALLNVALLMLALKEAAIASSKYVAESSLIRLWGAHMMNISLSWTLALLATHSVIAVKLMYLTGVPLTFV